MHGVLVTCTESLPLLLNLACLRLNNQVLKSLKFILRGDVGDLALLDIGQFADLLELFLGLPHLGFIFGEMDVGELFGEQVLHAFFEVFLLAGEGGL